MWVGSRWVRGRALRLLPPGKEDGRSWAKLGRGKCFREVGTQGMFTRVLLRYTMRIATHDKKQEQMH